MKHALYFGLKGRMRVFPCGSQDLKCDDDLRETHNLFSYLFSVLQVNVRNITMKIDFVCHYYGTVVA